MGDRGSGKSAVVEVFICDLRYISQSPPIQKQVDFLLCENISHGICNDRLGLHMFCSFIVSLLK